MAVGLTRQDRAALAKRLQNLGIGDWHKLIQCWMGFNAIYKTVNGSTERERLMNAVREVIQPKEAANLLIRLRDASDYLSQLPPGDMRRGSAHPGFRDRSTADLVIVNANANDPVEQLAHLMSVVYQVRCNLIHGSKDPDSLRDRRLVTSSTQILEPVLEAMFSASPGAN